MVLIDPRANLILIVLNHQERSYASWQAWIGMITFGMRRRCIGNLPKNPKMSSANKNSSTWQSSARRLPIALRIVLQAGSVQHDDDFADHAAWAFPRKVYRGERLANHVYRSARRVLQIAVRVGRARIGGRPILWKLKGG